MDNTVAGMDWRTFLTPALPIHIQESSCSREKSTTKAPHDGEETRMMMMMHETYSLVGIFVQKFENKVAETLRVKVRQHRWVGMDNIVR